MQIACDSCRVPVAVEDADLATGLARCRACNSVFRFSDDPELADFVRPRPKEGKPASIIRDAAGGRLTFLHRWFSLKIVFLTFFCLLWDGFLVVWYGMAFSADAPLVFKLFPLLHVAVGAGLTYYTIAGYVNTTVIALERGRLTVRHGPLPWPGNLELDSSRFRQFFCEEKVSRGKNGPHYSYNLGVVLADGTRKKLVTGLDTPQVPVYLEQELEAWLKIRDERVTGELAR